MMIVYLLCFSVLTEALHFARKNKKPFSARQCLLMSAWTLVSLQGYPLIASGEEYDGYYRDYRGYDRDYRDYGGYGRDYDGREYGKGYSGDPRTYSDRGYGGSYSREYGSAPASNNAPRPPVGINDFEKDLVQSIYANCYRSQRVSIENYGVPENLIMDYCSCASKNMYGRLSYEDFKLIEKIQGTGTPPPHEIQQKMEFVAMTCRKTSIDKIPPSGLETRGRMPN
ncbi:hypothetical protein [Methylobacter sp. YRD-M1]|uniref:hypothetical protein n=1 Tax=Methylobacter sp. YRD-M1 TaxID=2911520 RepID=UPI00227CE849|nr:hypothetical protein [Methylobacter sp. YRD-M1]WAK02283.1 hypothetical protein LZ558_00450 [Methylobacter sp. YRD-M1]